MRGVKPLVPLILIIVPAANAALIANIGTDKGNIAVELQYAKAPQAVANFITLAQGSRARVDPKTGSVTNAPLYIGEKFFRIVNDSTFKVAQTGSGTGDNSGQPGYLFRDEFDPTLPHVPYVLSMVNGGINTNGSQIFFTGSVGSPGLNNVHTVFGLVTNPASRSVIDAIINAPANGSTITSVSFSRTDAAAIAFNEHAQGLPEVSESSGSLRFVPDTSVPPKLSVAWQPSVPLPPRHQLLVFRSEALASWSNAGTFFLGNTLPPVAEITIDKEKAAKAFYRIADVHYVDDATPSLASSHFNISLPAAGMTINYDFNSSGTGGIVTAAADGPPESGPFTLVSNTVRPYKMVITTHNGDTINPPHLRYTVHSDDFAPGQSSGRVSVEYSFDGLFWSPFTSGTHTLSK
jgi:peptidyl-prolyl cis-trans isomerase A (cyclophilin A)